jgi:hypothetical protein
LWYENYHISLKKPEYPLCNINPWSISMAEFSKIISTLNLLNFCTWFALLWIWQWHKQDVHNLQTAIYLKIFKVLFVLSWDPVFVDGWTDGRTNWLTDWGRKLSLTNFQDSQAENVTSKVFFHSRLCDLVFNPRWPIFNLKLEIIKITFLTISQDICTETLDTRVLTRFYDRHSMILKVPA